MTSITDLPEDVLQIIVNQCPANFYVAHPKFHKFIDESLLYNSLPDLKYMNKFGMIDPIKVLKYISPENVRPLYMNGFAIYKCYLRYAEEFGNPSIIPALKAHAINVDDWGLHNAVTSKNKFIVDVLINEGVHLFTEIAIKNALNLHYEDIALYMIHKGIMVNDAIMTIACERGFLKTIKVLVAKGLKIKLHDIESVAANGHIDVLLYLINEGYTFSSHALTQAVSTGNMMIVRILIDKVPIHVNAMKMAIFHGNIKMIKFLMQHNAPHDYMCIKYARERGLLDLLTKKD